MSKLLLSITASADLGTMEWLTSRDEVLEAVQADIEFRGGAAEYVVREYVGEVEVCREQVLLTYRGLLFVLI